MQTPVNTFKQSLKNRQLQIGLWFGLANGYAAELAAGSGFDWILLDGEHAPNDVPRMLEQLQGVASAKTMLGHGSHPVARVPFGDVALIKQYLDLGAQTLLIPMVDTAAHAELLVRAMRYPQNDGRGGIRGMGAGLARASQWMRYPNYLTQANEQVCLLVQAETVTAMNNLDAIANTEGVDGVFFGPADLSANMGHVGDPGHPDVQSAIEDGIRRVIAAGKAPGILMADEKLARRYMDLGALFVAVGVDTIILSKALTATAGKFKASAPSAPAEDTKTSVYG
jgi:4-hydroxy-2-oxoheptanedioate aldolase